MKRRAAAGFTLLEVLLTITLVGAAVVLTTGGLHLGRRAWEAGDRRLDRMDQTVAAHALVRTALTQALPARLAGGATVGGGPTGGAVFSGGPDGVAFLAARPAGALGGGLHRVALAAAGDPGALRLELAVGPPGDAAPARVVLLDGLSAVGFRYFGPTLDDPVPRWRARWQRAGHLPTLVGLDLTFADGAAWPDLVVALPLR